MFRCRSKLGATSTTGTFSGTQLWVWQRCELFNYWPTYSSLWPRYNHPMVATILEENGALDCNWPPHSMIRGVEMKTSGAQCYKLMWSLWTNKKSKKDTEAECFILRPPPPSFQKIILQFFLWWIWLHICKKVWWPDSMKCMHMISRGRDHS